MNALLTLGTTTVPQLILGDAAPSGTDFGWAFRAINNNFYLATSTASATSTTAAFSISATGVPSFGDAPLGISSGGTNASSIGTSNGILAYNGTSILNFANFTLTSTLMTVSNATTTNVSVSQSLYATDASSTNRRVSGIHVYSFTLASSTVWNGTSSASSPFGDGATIYAGFTGAIESLQCGTDAGGLTVQVTSGGSSIYVIASTTAGYNPKVLNFSARAPITIVAGNHTSSPTSTPCTLNMHEN